MILLLTGKPGVGKSTAIERFISLNRLPSSWVVTRAILQPETGARVGFQAENSDGEVRVISHKTDIQSEAIIGQNRVDLEAVNALFSNALDEANDSEESLTIIDEIGPIQLLSEKFSQSLRRAFNSRANIIASIHYSDERLAGYRESPHHLLIEVTESNRDLLPDVLVSITKNLPVIHRLTDEQRAIFCQLLIGYIGQANMLRIQKLTSNAVHYVAEGSIQRIDDTHWRVLGKHASHQVIRNGDVLTCDCDLFNGRELYVGLAGECSHIQSVKMFNPAVAHSGE